MDRNSLLIPAAIVIAAGLISGAIFLSGSKSSPTVSAPTGNDVPVREAIEVRPIDDTDHIRGNPNAPVLFVEYSDYDCPFCKEFHVTMKQVMDEFGADGQVAWVYRHFPIEQNHVNAALLAEASECVAEIGGNDAFWTFSDKIFGERGRNELTDIARLPEFAENSGVSKDAFQTCLDSGTYKEKIAGAFNEARKAGAGGTPHTVVIIGNQVIPQAISGYIPFESGVINGKPVTGMKDIILSILEQVNTVNAAKVDDIEPNTPEAAN